MRKRVPVLLSLIIAFAGVLRFYGLDWGAPYFHFHIDEHFVFVGADLLRKSMKAAALSPKFFMYGALPMHLLNGLVWMHDAVGRPLDLGTFDDQVTYMVLGRAISATAGTLTALVTYRVAKRLAGPDAGLIAAVLLATSVIHIAESHSFRVDLTMVFFVTLAWLFAMRMVDEGRLRDYLLAGAFAGASIASKYSAAFIVGVIGVAHLLAPGRPTTVRDLRGWMRWTIRGVSPLLAAFAVFALATPMTFIYFGKFWGDVQDQIISFHTGAWRPIFVQQFHDVQPQLYWFTNMFWALGPAMEVWSLAGIVALLWRPDRRMIVAASFPLLYVLSAITTPAPMERYILPLAPGLAVTAAYMTARLMAAGPIWRRVAVVATTVTVASTALYAVAYMNVFRKPDARLEASAYLQSHIPAGSRILVEPQHSIPPTGGYLRNPDFHGDHVLWGAKREQHDYYSLYTLDTYVYLYNPRITDEQKREYIQSRLNLADYVLMDDFYLQLYGHLPEADVAPVKDYYRDLFNGELGFDLVKTFKRYPRIFGVDINDDGAELSSRMNDHPRVYLFMRRAPIYRGSPAPSAPSTN